MARAFGSGLKASYAGAIASGMPLTCSAWFKVTAGSMTVDEALSQITNNAGVESYYLSTAHLSSKIGAYVAHASSFFTDAVSTTTFSLGTWNHAVGVWNSATDRRAYLNGGGKGTATSSSGVPTGLNETNIGWYHQNGFTQYNDACVEADVCWWNVALTDGEIAALAAGVRPYLIRPQNIIAYWPLDGLVSPEVDISGNAHNMTLTGPPTAADGPPIDLFTPKAPSIFIPSSIVSSSAVGPLMKYYKQRRAA